MLKNELERSYFVYPSWANPPFQWDELQKLLHAPLISGLIENTDPEYWAKLGYQPENPEFHFLKGAFGGGVFWTDNDPLEIDHSSAIPTSKRWLFMNVLRSGNTQVTCIDELLPYSREVGCNVAYLEAGDTAETFLGLAPKPRNFSINGTVEHLGVDTDRIFWAVRIKRAKRALKGLADFASIASAFGIELNFLDSPGEEFLSITEPWFDDPDRETQWFEVRSQNKGVGFHFALAVYAGFHLRYIGGPRIRSIHLIANLESKFNRAESSILSF
ncbi:MAG TPA: hypothetical protein DCY03_17090 [Planctomycetaceae bacterium]|nr:hypothetical protein [Planctomycetaceae bacterium]|tara:strand:- start:30512 stop:31330 length:819 start_codon:yes stop_codon:yes gene_type:complete